MLKEAPDPSLARADSPVSETKIHSKIEAVGGKNGWLILWLMLAVLTGALVFALGHWHWVSWNEIARYRGTAQNFAARHRIAASAIFALAYVAGALMLFPAQLWVIVVGAFLFGFWEGALTSWVCAMLGAATVFAAARTVFGPAYLKSVGAVTARISAEFARDPILIMLSLRWLPVSPYALANAAPPLMGAAFAPYLWIASIGILPDIVTYSLVGATLRGLADLEHPPSLSGLTANIAPILVVVGAAPVMALILRRILSAHGSSLVAEVQAKLSLGTPPTDPT